MTMSFNHKAQSAFKNLGAVALITATTLTALLFSACVLGQDVPKPEHVITFSVEGGNGTLKAEADGVAETQDSPIKVQENKAVTFKAKANRGYIVKGWMLDGNAVNGTGNVYTFTVTKPATVSVSFEAVPQDTAFLTVDPQKKAIVVKVKTADGSLVQVQGCTETSLAHDTETTLNATGERVILKGKIIVLECWKKNQLNALNVQGLTSLQELHCSENKLTELDLQGLTDLQVVDCWRNQLEELNVQGCTGLQDLKASSNKLKSLDVSGCTTLGKLSCGFNELTSLNLSGCTALQEIICFYNKLTELSLQGFHGLTKFHCCGNQFGVKAMTELLKALPNRYPTDNAEALLYSEESFAKEGNCKDYGTPEELKAAFESAKGNSWELKKKDASGNAVAL